MMKLKIPPGIVFIISAFLMWLISKYAGMGKVDLPIAIWLYTSFLAVGVLFGAAALLQFYGSSTTVDPHNPEKTSHLVKNGIYKLSRNPMYTGLLFLLIALAIRLENLFTFLILPPFVLYMNRFQIIPEEQVLKTKFGDEFESYCSNVRRWL